LFTKAVENGLIFDIINGRFYAGDDNEFVMYSISHIYSWDSDKTSAIADIKKAGANTISIVLSRGYHGKG